MRSRSFRSMCLLLEVTVLVWCQLPRIAAVWLNRGGSSADSQRIPLGAPELCVPALQRVCLYTVALASARRSAGWRRTFTPVSRLPSQTSSPNTMDFVALEARTPAIRDRSRHGRARGIAVAAGRGAPGRLRAARAARVRAAHCLPHAGARPAPGALLRGRRKRDH